MGTYLETPRMLLRPFALDDARDLYIYASDPRVGPAAGWKPHESMAESRQIICTVFAQPHVFAVVEKADGRVIGSAESRHSDQSFSEIICFQRTFSIHKAKCLLTLTQRHSL